MHPHVGHPQVFGRLHTGGHLGHGIGPAGDIRDIAHRVETGDGELFFKQVAHCGRGVVGAKRPVLAGQLPLVDAPQLNALHAGLPGHSYKFLPAVSLPAIYRKRKSHCYISSYTILLSAFMYAWMLAPITSVDIPCPAYSLPPARSRTSAAPIASRPSVTAWI